MNHSPIVALLVSLLVAGAVASCARDAPAPAPPSAPAPSAVATAAQTLDGLDPRTPVPLVPPMALHQKQNMQDHLVAVQEMVSALAVEDYAALERAAGRIGFSEQMGQMCTHMGAGAPGFTGQALAFHHTADGIVAAAKARDRGAVVKELGATLEACTACHAKWKQQVVSEDDWQRLTSSAPPVHGAAH